MTAGRLLAPTGAALCLALMGARLVSAVSFAEPLQVTTSGAEWESLFALWRFTQGLAVHTDRFAPPFNEVVYNWLFYEAYGWWTQVILRLTGLGDAWLPTVGRLFTVVGAAFGGLAAFHAFARAGAERVQAGALAVLIGFGPLVGFWAITVRPDVWAASLEIAAVALFLAAYPRRRWTALLALIGLAYLGWSFKQLNVYAVGAAGLFLLVRRQWAMLLVLVAATLGAWAATFLVGSEQFVRNILFGDYPLVFTVERGLRNFANFAVKSGPTLLPAAVLAAIAARGGLPRRWWLNDDAVLMALAGIVVSVVVAVPTAAQSGASENYFFTPAFFLALLAAAALGPLGEAARRALAWSAGIGWTSLAAALVLVLAGVTGVIDVRDQHAWAMRGKACLDRLPRPLYVTDQYLSLPWMSPGTEPLVVSYVYERDRARGRPFVGDGIAGMVRRRAFAAIAVPGDVPPERMDGAPLDGYVVRPDACPGMSVFLRDGSK